MGLELGVLVADAALLPRALDVLGGVDEAQLFLMDDGVRAAASPRLLAAIDDGLDAALCAMDAEARGVARLAGGPRFGSQWDHACMVRDAARVIALTGAPIADCTPSTSPRHVAVRITRAEKAASALRSAVGYAGVGLQVTIVLATAIGEHAKAIATLRGMGARFVDAPVACDLEVAW